jgi:hypothetical protein
MSVLQNPVPGVRAETKSPDSTGTVAFSFAPDIIVVYVRATRFDCGMKFSACVSPRLGLGTFVVGNYSSNNITFGISATSKSIFTITPQTSSDRIWCIGYKF